MEINNFKNKKGLRILHIFEPTLPTFTVTLLIKGGSSVEQKGKNGLASISRSICTRSNIHLAIEIDKLGAYLGSSTGRTYSLFSSQCDPKYFKKLLSNVFKIINHPKDTESNLKKEKLKHIKDIKDLEDDSREHAINQFETLIWQNAVLENSSIGNRKDITNISIQDLDIFRKQFWTNNNSLLIICGNIDKKEVIDNTEYLTLNSENTDNYPSLKLQQETRIKIINKDLPQTVFAMGGFGPSYLDKDYNKFRLVKIMLGGGFGSKLMQRIRENGLAYYSYSYAETNFLSGIWAAVAGVDRSKLSESIIGCIRIFKDLKEGRFTGDEIQRAKELFKGSLITHSESSPEIALFLGLQEFNTGKIETMEDIINQVCNINKEEIVEMCRKYINGPYSLVINGFSKAKKTELFKIISE